MSDSFVNRLLFFMLFLGIVVVLAGATIGGRAVANGDEPPFSEGVFAGDVMATWGATSSFCSLAVPNGNLSDGVECLRLFHVNHCVFLVTGYVETYHWVQEVAQPYVEQCLAPLQFVLDALDSGSPALPIS